MENDTRRRLISLTSRLNLYKNNRGAQRAITSSAGERDVCVALYHACAFSGAQAKLHEYTLMCVSV